MDLGREDLSTFLRAEASKLPTEGDVWKDVRHGVRSLIRDKGWTTVVVVSLALGIGANTALFSAVNGLYLRKLPVTQPDSLVRLKWVGRNDMATNSSDYGSSLRVGTENVRSTVSYPMYRQYLEDNRTMEDLFASRRTAAPTSSRTAARTSRTRSSRQVTITDARPHGVARAHDRS